MDEITSRRGEPRIPYIPWCCCCCSSCCCCCCGCWAGCCRGLVITRVLVPTVAGSRIKLSSARRWTSPPFITLTITSPYSRGLPHHRPPHGVLTHPRVHSPPRRPAHHHSIVRLTTMQLLSLSHWDRQSHAWGEGETLACSLCYHCIQGGTVCTAGRTLAAGPSLYATCRAPVLPAWRPLNWCRPVLVIVGNITQVSFCPLRRR